METGPLRFSQLFVHYNFDFLFCVVNHREKIDHSFFTAQDFREIFFGTASQIFSFEILSQSLLVDFGVFL